MGDRLPSHSHIVVYHSVHGAANYHVGLGSPNFVAEYWLGLIELVGRQSRRIRDCAERCGGCRPSRIVCIADPPHSQSSRQFSLRVHSHPFDVRR